MPILQSYKRYLVPSYVVTKVRHRDTTFTVYYCLSALLACESADATMSTVWIVNSSRQSKVYTDTIKAVLLPLLRTATEGAAVNG